MSPGSALRRRLPVLLRLFTLGSRFLLIFFLARLLAPSEVGLYGLLTAMSGYAVLALGFDFYTYSTRQIIREPRDSWRGILKSQASFAALLYIVGYPVIVLLFVFGLLPWDMLWWFLILIPLEHIGLELDRTLIAMGDQLGASIGMFVRQATTPLLVVPAMFIWDSLRNLETVLLAWIAFDVLGILVGIAFLRRQVAASEHGKVDWRWIWAGARIALPFLIGTLCLRAIFTMDRQFVAAAASLEVLGAYTLFMAIAGGMTQVLGAGVHQFLYPKLVAHSHEKSRTAFFAVLKSLAVQTVVVVVIIVGGAMLLEPALLAFIGEPIYAKYSFILPWALAVTGLYNLSLVPHFGLYALDRDRTILYITCAGFLAFASILAVGFGLDPIPRVVIALGTASVILLIGKAVALALAIPKVKWD